MQHYKVNVMLNSFSVVSRNAELTAERGQNGIILKLIDSKSVQSTKQNIFATFNDKL